MFEPYNRHLPKIISNAFWKKMYSMMCYKYADLIGSIEKLPLKRNCLNNF